LKAVVLAGGYATRLRPISYALPKLLFPVVGKPMIYWTFDLLQSIRITEVVLGVNYMAETLRARVGSTYRGMTIKYSLETKELGTAGPMKLASTNANLNETFIAMNGDVIAQIDLRDMLRQHQQSKALITDALHLVRDPARFGVAQMDQQKRIQHFVEKPKTRAAPSRLVNAGIYIIEPSVLQLIPENRKVSLEREIFPGLAKEGRLFGFEFSGYWFDIGSLTDFRKANFALQQYSELQPQVQDARIAADAVIQRPVSLGNRSSVDSKARVGPKVIVGNNASIGKSAKVASSILFDEVTVGEYSEISDAIISTGVKVGNHAKVGRGCIIAPHVRIADRTKIGAGAIIHPYKEITENVRAKAHVM
jgi:mannose-1-phosphate guanylyltransferase